MEKLVGREEDHDHAGRTRPGEGRSVRGAPGRRPQRRRALSDDLDRPSLGPLRCHGGDAAGLERADRGRCPAERALRARVAGRHAGGGHGRARPRCRYLQSAPRARRPADPGGGAGQHRPAGPVHPAPGRGRGRHPGLLPRRRRRALYPLRALPRAHGGGQRAVRAAHAARAHPALGAGFGRTPGARYPRARCRLRAGPRGQPAGRDIPSQRVRGLRPVRRGDRLRQGGGRARRPCERALRGPRLEPVRR